MDRINSQPDDLLCHVLSFLPTKDAALTCVLSKRWLNLWKLVPDLDIDDSVFLHPEVGKAKREEIRQSFVDFVDSVLAMQGDSPIKNFSLKCINGLHPDIVNRWMRNVVQRGVVDLNLVTRYSCRDASTDLPIEMFFSSTLVKLKITSEDWVDWWHPNMGSSLPMLKSLDIDSSLVHFWGEIDKFISSFPVLEELRMANMHWEYADVTVSSASLRKLSLHARGCLVWNPPGFENLKGFSFNTPNLLFLNYSDLVPDHYPLVNMGKLLEARINLSTTNEEIKGEGEPSNDLFGDVVKLMNGLKNVQRLTLSSDTLEVLSQCTESIPVFNNLKFLGVSSEEGRGWQAMPVILMNCPHLETIIMEGLLHSVTDECGDACPCISREDKGRSLTSCPVNRLEIKGFQATMKEMNMIKHFLDYFPCLKSLDVFTEENAHTHLRNREDRLITEMFDLYNKLSPSCNVQLLVSNFLDKKSNAPGHI